MIVPFKSGQYGGDEFVVCPPASTSVPELRERMLARAKVTIDSYAYRLIDDLHAGIFLRSLDLKKDYEIYFASEYESFGEYLRRRTHFQGAVVAQLSAVHAASSGMYHFDPAYSFLADTYGLDFLTRLLEDLPAGGAR